MIDDLFETISAEEEQQSKTLLMKHKLNERIQKNKNSVESDVVSEINKMPNQAKDLVFILYIKLIYTW